MNKIVESIKEDRNNFKIGERFLVNWEDENVYKIETEKFTCIYPKEYFKIIE